MISHNKINIKENRTPAVTGGRIDSTTWTTIEHAFRERIDAIELFLADVAGRFRFRSVLTSNEHELQTILAEREHLAAELPNFQKRVWLASADLVCDSSGAFWFVDEHFCCPYGLARIAQLMEQSTDPLAASTFLAFQQSVREAIQAKMTEQDSAIVLGSGTFNTAYRENRFFAEFLGLPYVTRQRLEMRPNGLFLQHPTAPRKIQLVVRRLQDEDLDSGCYRVNSMQGVRGLVKGARRGQLRLLNGAGTSLLNHRIIGRHIPAMIRFYLNKEPSLPTIPTAPVNGRLLQPESNALLGTILRTDNSMDLMKPLIGSVSSDAAKARYAKKMAVRPNAFVQRTELATVTGGLVEADYALRIFSAGCRRRVILRAGLRRDCYGDGTPLLRVTQDEAATAVVVDDVVKR